MRKLLYVEDNEDNLYMLQLRFDVLGGYEVLSARDGAAGIAMAASERPDLILMDLDLPEIDGGGDAPPQGRPGDARHSDHRAELARDGWRAREGPRYRLR
jgi:hypothetical protein